MAKSARVRPKGGLSLARALTLHAVGIATNISSGATVSLSSASARLEPANRSSFMSEKKVTYVTLLADQSIHPKYEEALKQVEKDFGKHRPMHINGRNVLAGEGEFADKCPIDPKIILGYFQKGTRLYAPKAIAAATEAFHEWSRRPWTERAAIIQKAADLMEEKQFYLPSHI